MQSLNDDMEELFRRAADEYPLNTDSADWNKVMQRLQHTEEDAPKANNKRKDYRYLWLLLLLPLGFMLGRYFDNGHKLNTARAGKDVALANAGSGKTGPATSKSEIRGVKPKGTGSEASVKDEVPGKEVTAGRIDNFVGASPSGSNKDRLLFESKPGHKLHKPTLPSERTEGTQTNGATDEKETASTDLPSPPVVGSAAKTKDLTIGTDAAAGATPSAEANVAPNPNQANQATEATNNKNENKSADNQNIGISNQSKKQQTSFKRKVYYSFLIGPDISTVKLERASSAGYSLGLLLGYQISKKISFESGVMWDRKKYNATGEYLDTSRLHLPHGSIVSKVDGYCDMIEIPVNVKYNFSTKQNHSWFVSAGLSSYLMQKENYNLTYERYSMPYQKDYGYKNSTKDWFSILNISAGYQKSLGKYTFISIAPYVKLPLKGIGIGKLPITSTGIFLSVSRSIH